MKTVLLINHEGGMGHGAPELGQKILRTFLTKAPAALHGLEAVVFYNSGVKLVVEGSELLAPLSTLHDQGVDVIACGTCVDAYELRDRIRVAEVGSMDQILKELEAAEKVITL